MNIADRISIKLASKRAPSASVLLSQRNIYIFPSKIGFAFLLLLSLMLLTAINYQNSLIYLFTFFLGGIFFISIWLCFLNISGVRIASGDTVGCFAGESVPYEIKIWKEGATASAVLIVLDDYKVFIDELSNHEKTRHSLLGRPRSRGVHLLDRIYLHSYFPFGLIRAWTWQRLDAKAHVYPKPINGKEVRLGSASSHKSEHQHESDEPSDLVPYKEGDSAKRIVWKRYAAREELVTRQREKASFDSDWVRWDDYDVSNKELKLSYMCYDVMEHFSKRTRYGLELPGRVIQPGVGELHKTKCLQALAEY